MKAYQKPEVQTTVILNSELMANAGLSSWLQEAELTSEANITTFQVAS